MSSDSENEFFDAVDITPERLEIIKEQKPVSIKTSSSTVFNNAQLSLTPKPVKAPASRQNSLSSKLASSLPTLHIPESPRASAHQLLQDLDGSFKENVVTTMPPPAAPPLKSRSGLQIEVNVDTGDAASVCSESMLSYLADEDASAMQRKENTRKRRHRGEKVEIDQDDVPSILSSSYVSRSSSSDGIFPPPGSAPFRVIEHDTMSVYSTSAIPPEKPPRLPDVEENPDTVKTEEEKDVDDVKSEENTSSTDSHTEPSIVLSSEPDIVASTKSNSLPREEVEIRTQVQNQNKPRDIPVIQIKEDVEVKNEPDSSKQTERPMPPVVPPRRNKIRKTKERPHGDRELSKSYSGKDADSISSQYLDIFSAIKGDYIVNSKDNASSKGVGPSQSQVNIPECVEKLDNEPNINSICEEHASKDRKASLKSQKSTTSGSKEYPSDHEILQNIKILNLDTGESIPLSEAEKHLPSALNPLSLHIMKLTNEYTQNEQDEDSDERSVINEGTHRPESDAGAVKHKALKIKSFIGKTVGSAVNKAKNIAHEVSHKGKDDKDVFEDVAPAQNTMQYVKIRTSHGHKGPLEFDNLMYAQELKGEHTGPIWCMKFSPCGRLLATAGQDHVLRVWVLKQAFNYFLDIRTKWNADVKTSPTPSQESLSSQVSSQSSEDLGTLDPNDDGFAPFMPKPFCVYTGHTADVLDLSWSKHYFILTSSMDKTARLWHISRKECLCIFKHVDFVTAIAFHPKDDRYFISGSLDGKIRLWSIPDKQVVLWNEVDGHPKLITAANFCQNGTYTVVGTYNGRCIFYKTAELKYFTQIYVKSSRGKNAKGRKITGIEQLPDEDKLLITSNDSRIRLYDLNVLDVSCKYKGHSNFSSQIRAGFSHDGKYIVSGSENQCIYIWKTSYDYSRFSSARKDRNVFWEGVKAHSAVVTCAVFSSHPEHVFNFIEHQESIRVAKPDKAKDSTASGSNKGYVLVSADFNGVIKVFIKKEKPKHSSLPASAMN